VASGVPLGHPDLTQQIADCRRRITIVGDFIVEAKHRATRRLRLSISFFEIELRRRLGKMRYAGVQMRGS